MMKNSLELRIQFAKDVIPQEKEKKHKQGREKD